MSIDLVVNIQRIPGKDLGNKGAETIRLTVPEEYYHGMLAAGTLLFEDKMRIGTREQYEEEYNAEEPSENFFIGMQPDDWLAREIEDRDYLVYSEEECEPKTIPTKRYTVFIDRDQYQFNTNSFIEGANQVLDWFGLERSVIHDQTMV